MERYEQRIRKILMYSVLLILITLIYVCFGKLWELMSKFSFLNVSIIVPVTKFVSLYGTEITITALLSVGLILTAILLYLIARQILKIIVNK